MQSSSSNGIKKLNEEYEDDLFRLVMNNVAEKEGKLLLEENERLKEDPEYMLSQENLKKFTKLLGSHLKKANRLWVPGSGVIQLFTTCISVAKNIRLLKSINIISK